MSKKILTYIHLVPGKVAARLDVAQPFHQRINLPRVPALRRILQQPSAKSRIERRALGTDKKQGRLDQVVIRAEGNVLPANPV